MKAERHARLVVIDTHVWISAALSPSGAPAQLISRALQSGLIVLTTRTFVELETRLWRPKFDAYLTMEARQRILHDLDAAACWVDVPVDIGAQSCCRDPDDDAFIHAALAAQASRLVMGDQDLLSVTPLPLGLRILTPAAALRQPGWAR